MKQAVEGAEFEICRSLTDIPYGYSDTLSWRCEKSIGMTEVTGGAAIDSG